MVEVVIAGGSMNISANIVAAILDAGIRSQLALLKAAKAAGVKRFAPSEFGSSVNTTYYLSPPKIEVWDAVKQSGLEATRLITGIYINMFAGGSNLPSEREAVSHDGSGKMLLDARAGTVGIPGDGTGKLTFTSAQDIGKFVAASLDLDEWEDVSGIVGETTTWNEVVDVAEAITGKEPQRTWLKEGSSERAKKKLESDFYSALTKSIVAGHWLVEPTLNKRLPNIPPFTVEQYLRKYWDGADWSTPAADV